MKSSSIRILIVVCILIGLSFGCASVGSNRVNPRRHPNLAAAQREIERAINKVSAAQLANEFDMNGHAARAKNLLEQAYDEIKLAALAANANR
ncbi:MAG: hypothetical protein NTW95_03590 [Candidatus Aminicenantes bacterium]|nr:hypothetical protein [Candidatus Aminicenantes bacterium]